jgi:hypothetical protein
VRRSWTTKHADLQINPDPIRRRTTRLSDCSCSNGPVAREPMTARPTSLTSGRTWRGLCKLGTRRSAWVQAPSDHPLPRSRRLLARGCMWPVGAAPEVGPAATGCASARPQWSQPVRACDGGRQRVAGQRRPSARLLLGRGLDEWDLPSGAEKATARRAGSGARRPAISRGGSARRSSGRTPSGNRQW